jgi:hypothetical protein
LLAQRVDEFHNGDQSRSAIVGQVKLKKASSASKKSRRKYKKLEEEKAAAAAEVQSETIPDATEGVVAPANDIESAQAHQPQETQSERPT